MGKPGRNRKVLEARSRSLCSVRIESTSQRATMLQENEIATSELSLDTKNRR